MELLAIMGRGIQMHSPELDPEDADSWVLTNLLEITDERGRHLPVRHPQELNNDVDSHPQARIGGSKFNVEAGAMLLKLRMPLLVVCAYGHRSPYLDSVNGPTESEIMSRELTNLADDSQTEVMIWARERTRQVPSNTGSEVENIFELALERSYSEVCIVTVGVHVPRTMTYVSKYQSRHPRYRHLKVQVLESEELLKHRGKNVKDEIDAMRVSSAFMRSWASEADGIQKIIRDVYKDFA